MALPGPLSFEHALGFLENGIFDFIFVLKVESDPVNVLPELDKQ